MTAAFEQVISPKKNRAWLEANPCLLRVAYGCGDPAVRQIVRLAEDGEQSRLFFLAVDEYRRAMEN